MNEQHAYRLELLATGKEWLTANQRLFWRVRAVRTRQWRDYAAERARAKELPLIERARVVCELRFCDARRRDPGNWAPTAKAVVDGLVDAGVFTDDDHTHVTGPDMRIGPKVLPAWRGMHLLIYPQEKL